MSYPTTRSPLANILAHAEYKEIPGAFPGELEGFKLYEVVGNPDVETNFFIRLGEYWSIALAGAQQVRLKDSVGLRYIAQLIQRSGEPIHVHDLALVAENSMTQLPTADAALASGLTLDSIDSSFRDQMTDPRSIKAYKDRICILNDIIEDAESRGDNEQVAKATEEKLQIADHLRSNTGLLNRPRIVSGNEEKQRKAVAAAVRDALARMKAVDEALFRHFDASLKLGKSCSYYPSTPMNWNL